MISVMIISIDFSNELIPRMSVRKTYELIDSPNSLVKSVNKVLLKIFCNNSDKSFALKKSQHPNYLYSQ